MIDAELGDFRDFTEVEEWAGQIAKALAGMPKVVR
jgi:hypothetical protein